MNEDHCIGFVFGLIFGFCAGIAIAVLVFVTFKALVWLPPLLKGVYSV